MTDNLNPVWNEHHQLCVESLDGFLSLKVFDQDDVGKDDPLGECRVVRPGAEIFAALSELYSVPKFLATEISCLDSA